MDYQTGQLVLFICATSVCSNPDGPLSVNDISYLDAWTFGIVIEQTDELTWKMLTGTGVFYVINDDSFETV
jgi:hypothetical protein